MYQPAEFKWALVLSVSEVNPPFVDLNCSCCFQGKGLTQLHFSSHKLLTVEINCTGQRAWGTTCPQNAPEPNLIRLREMCQKKLQPTESCWQKRGWLCLNHCLGGFRGFSQVCMKTRTHDYTWEYRTVAMISVIHITACGQQLHTDSILGPSRCNLIK